MLPDLSSLRLAAKPPESTDGVPPHVYATDVVGTQKLGVRIQIFHALMGTYREIPGIKDAESVQRLMVELVAYWLKVITDFDEVLTLQRGFPEPLSKLGLVTDLNAKDALQLLSPGNSYMIGSASGHAGVYKLQGRALEWMQELTRSEGRFVRREMVMRPNADYEIGRMFGELILQAIASHYGFGPRVHIALFKRTPLLMERQGVGLFHWRLKVKADEQGMSLLKLQARHYFSSMQTVMEQYDGDCTQDKIMEEPTFWKKLAALIESASKRGIVHGDMKPQNVLYRRDPSLPDGFELRLTDFDPEYVAVIDLQSYDRANYDLVSCIAVMQMAAFCGAVRCMYELRWEEGLNKNHDYDWKSIARHEILQSSWEEWDDVDNDNLLESLAQICEMLPEGVTAFRQRTGRIVQNSMARLFDGYMKRHNRNCVPNEEPYTLATFLNYAFGGDLPMGTTDASAS